METETDTNTGHDDTETSQTQEAKTFTQDEVNAMMAKSKSNIEKKFTKQFDGVDVEEYKLLKEASEKAVRKDQIKKGEFDKIMEETATKHNAEMTQLNTKIHEYTINTPIITAAAELGANHPEQVRMLIKDSIRLTDTGDVEVIDGDGKTRYNDDGKPFSVTDRVREYLDSNQHFVQPTPSTTNTQSNQDVKVPGELDITKLDMNDPDDRARYAEYRKLHGIA